MYCYGLWVLRFASNCLGEPVDGSRDESKLVRSELLGLTASSILLPLRDMFENLNSKQFFDSVYTENKFSPYDSHPIS